ncbi:TAF4 domain-containing protein [Mycena kentingensis (nom. inval.)]|nr:TAF4 domain-containing protein [Mycena kentingensis (nom. inval.)]
MSVPALSAEILDSLISFDSDAPDNASTSTPAASSEQPSAATVASVAAAAAAFQQMQYNQHYQQYYTAAPAQSTSYGHTQSQGSSSSQSMARQAITNSAAAGSGSSNTDVATLNDALGSAGVDLRAEEESLQRSHTVQQQNYASGSFEDRARKQPPRPSFDPTHLHAKMQRVATQHNVAGGGGVSEDCVNYLALALRARLQDLVTAMIGAARHRASAKYDKKPSLYEDGTAAWGVMVRADVEKQLAALEVVDREEEERERELRRRKDAALQLVLAAIVKGEDMELEEPTFEQVVADRRRAQREAVAQNRANRMVNGLAGIKTFQWLKTALPQTTKPNPYQPVPPPPPPTEPPRPYQTPTAGARTASDGKLSVSVRDLIFVVEKERGHGGGRGAARGWT